MRLDRCRAVVERAADDVGEVLGLLVQHVRVAGGEAGLGVAHQEAVREAVHVHAVQRAHAVGPPVGQAHAAAAEDLHAGAAAVVGADLEAGREDQAVELVLAAGDDDAARRDALDAAALGVDERDVVAVEGLEVLVVEAGALAELPVPGLQRRGRRRVLDVASMRARIDSIFSKSASSTARSMPSGVKSVDVAALHAEQQIRDDVGPAVADEVLGLRQCRRRGC